MGRTSNPVLYLHFGENISLLGMLKYIPILWGPTSSAKKLCAPEGTKVFICCIGDITKDNRPKIKNIAIMGSHNDWPIPPATMVVSITVSNTCICRYSERGQCSKESSEDEAAAASLEAVGGQLGVDHMIGEWVSQ